MNITPGNFDNKQLLDQYHKLRALAGAAPTNEARQVDLTTLSSSTAAEFKDVSFMGTQAQPTKVASQLTTAAPLKNDPIAIGRWGLTKFKPTGSLVLKTDFEGI